MDFIKIIFRKLFSLIACAIKLIKKFFQLNFWGKTKVVLVGFVGLAIVWYSIGWAARAWEFRDDHPERGAKVVKQDPLENSKNPSEIIYLEQNWDNDDSMWFYNVTQGSNLLPYDFFLVLEKVDSEELFRGDENIMHYRYLPQVESELNPDGLPLGMAKDVYKGNAYMGFTCAACHTTQINYGDKGIRIDGGPAMADMENFMRDLAKALLATANDETKFKRFAEAVIDLGEYKHEAKVKEDLLHFGRQIQAYVVINNPVRADRPLTQYGYGRLDAFGRIFNRVAEHLVNPESFKDALRRVVSKQKYEAVVKALDGLFTADDQSHLLDKIIQKTLDENLLDRRDIMALRTQLFNPADAPVSYPFLWDIPQHDFVQWNGVVGNEGIGPMGRNAGQVVGVFGTLDWAEEEGFSLSSLLTGQGLTGKHIRFDSSIDIRNLRRVETHLRKLHSPEWPQGIFGEINTTLADEGRKIFDDYCEACHERIDPKDPKRRIVAFMSDVDDVGTDQKMALNSVNATAYSGIVKGDYVAVGDAGDILLERKAPVAALLTKATASVLVTPDPDKVGPIQRWAERIFDLLWTITDNEVKRSMKVGTYEPATTAKPLADLMAYKGRSLNGIWATAPYLHNGSIPSLYHLLLPKKRADDPEDGEYRPDEFYVGSREFKPDIIGFEYTGENAEGLFRFDTAIVGNGNQGHEYAAGRTPLPNGELLPPLNETQRKQLLEYLKTL